MGASVSSLRQISANRQNALKSTGPRTEVGKMHSRVNAFRHGFRASQSVTVLERSAEFKVLRANLFEQLKPSTVIEQIEVDRLARAYWTRNRAELALTEMLNTEICTAIKSKSEQDLKITTERLQKIGRVEPENRDRRHERKCRKMQQHYESVLRFDEEVKRMLQNNSIGVGAALCRLSGNGDKLTTLMRYLTHWEREAERVAQHLVKLKGGDEW